MKLQTIYNEPCLETLRRMPDEFVDMVMTSPPFYGLRSYGTEPQIWGNHNGCSHVWGDTVRNPKADPRSAEQKRAQGATIGGTINFNVETANGTSGNFCQSCNAWRGELGLEPTFQLYISHLIDIFREVKRVLKPTGTVWVNLGDSYGTNSGNARQMQNGTGGKSKEAVQTRYSNPFINQPRSLHKSLMNIPARFAIAMTDELQFINRNHIIWHKPACMPSSAKDRFTVDFESIFFFTKSEKYWFEQQLEPIAPATIGRNQYPHSGGGDYSIARKRLPGEFATKRTAVNGQGSGESASGQRFGHYESRRNMRTVWSVNFEPSGEEHYASYPTRLVTIPILAGCPENGVVYDPFSGTGTTFVVAHKLNRRWVGSELNPKYYELANKRLEPYLAQANLFGT